MTMEIILQITGEHDKYGLKSVQRYFNLFPDARGDIIINGLHCGEADIHTVGHIIDLGLKHQLRCRRCEHEWFCRSNSAPKYCPQCNSPYWDKLRKADNQS